MIVPMLIAMFAAAPDRLRRTRLGTVLKLPFTAPSRRDRRYRDGQRAIGRRSLLPLVATMSLVDTLPLPAQPMTSIGANSNGAEVCSVVEAAYNAAAKPTVLSYPRSLAGPWHPADDLKDFVPAYRARLPLSAAEFADLQSEQPHYVWSHFVPDCRWKGKMDDRPEQAKTTTSFTFPIFSKDRSIAIVDVSFYRGSFGHGDTCVARRSGETWTAQCLAGWIT